jgi:hypothetical protein
VKVTYVPGHNPDLIIKDDSGITIETVNLSGVWKFTFILKCFDCFLLFQRTTDEIHAIMAEKGFQRKVAAVEAEL